jgi:hypothetical protein
MSAVEAQVQRARRRITAGLLAERLCQCVLAAAGLWGVAIIAARLFAWDVPLWHGAWLAAALVAVTTALATAYRRPTALRAAVTLDAAAGLKERLSTALLVRGQADPFAAAACADAERNAAHLHVPTHIRVAVPPTWPWALATMLAAVLLCQFMPSVGLLRPKAKGPGVPRAALEAEQQAIQAELEEQRARLKELTDAQPDLKDLASELPPLELPDNPGLTPEDVRREAVKQIDNVRDKLEQQMRSAEGAPLTELKRMLNKLQPERGDTAAARLSEALASGDLKTAQQALTEMRKEVTQAAEQAADPEAQAKLAAIQEQLERLAEQLSQLADSSRLLKDLENLAGLSPEEAQKLLDELAGKDPDQLAQELQRRLANLGLNQQQLQALASKLQENRAAQQACQKLAQNLRQAAQQCQSAGSAAAGSLANACGQLSELQMAEDLLNEARARLSDLEGLRDRVCQGQCSGKYGRRGRESGKFGRGNGSQGPQAGLGYGSRIGKEETDYATDPTKAPTRPQGGEITGQMLIDGPQIRGAASREALAAAEAEARDALDAVEREEVPRQYRKVLQEYFERLAGLVSEKRSQEQR